MSVSIDRTPQDVYDYAADVTHLPDWAFFESVEPAGDGWTATVPDGDPVTIHFTPRNELGVLDHVVDVGGGETVSSVMRVVANGAGSELLFTVFRRPAGTDAQFDADVATVARDLGIIKHLLEG